MNRIPEIEAMTDSVEIKSFNSLSTTDQNNLLNECFVLSVFNLGIPCGKILDLGTGNGLIPIKIALGCKDFFITGIDMSEEMLAFARKNAAENKVDDRIKFDLADAKDLPYPDNYFDIVICHLSLHHMKDPVKVLKETDRVLKKDGAILIRDMKRPEDDKTLASYVKLFGNGYSPLEKKILEESFLASYTKEEFEDLAAKANLKNYEIKEYFVTHIGLEKRAKNFQSPVYTDNLPKETDYLSKLILNYYISK